MAIGLSGTVSASRTGERSPEQFKFRDPRITHDGLFELSMLVTGALWTPSRIQLGVSSSKEQPPHITLFVWVSAETQVCPMSCEP